MISIEIEKLVVGDEVYHMSAHSHIYTITAKSKTGFVLQKNPNYEEYFRSFSEMGLYSLKPKLFTLSRDIEGTRFTIRQIDKNVIKFISLLNSSHHSVEGITELISLLTEAKEKLSNA